MFRRTPPLGTPENPEIIEPGDRPRGEARTAIPGRWWTLLRLLRWMISVTLPAVLLDSICFWLFDAAHAGAGPFAWLLLAVFALPAALATLAAAAANIVLLVLFAGVLLGRDVRVGFQPILRRMRP